MRLHMGLARLLPRPNIRPASVVAPGETQVIALANQKGGVAKTTTTLNLGVAFAEQGFKVLLVDLDPQGNLTMSQGLNPDTIERSMFDVLVHRMPITQVIETREVDIAVSSIDLAGADMALSSQIGRERALEKGLAPVRDDYDFILIDCPPSLGLITLNMLAAADSLLIPLQCEYYALEGLSQLLNTVHLIQHGVNPSLAISGVLLTMYDARLNLSRQVAADAREYFGSQVFETVVPRNVRLAEAPSFGKPIVLYDVQSIGAQAYMAIAHELIAREAGKPARANATASQTTTPAPEVTA